MDYEVFEEENKVVDDAKPLISHAEKILHRYACLDPLFHVYCKLFIAQMKMLKLECPNLSVYLLNGRYVHRAEVVGLVVYKSISSSRANSCLTFAMDDGTGLLEVKHWQKSFQKKPKLDWDVLRLGNYVRVRGDFSTYKERLQMSAYSVEILEQGSDGALEELKHWKRVVELNEKEYLQKAPPVPQAWLEEKKLYENVLLDKSKFASSKLECMGKIIVLLNESKEGELREEALFNVVSNDRNMIREALISICDNGVAYWGENHNVVQIRSEANLAFAILELIREKKEDGIKLTELETQLWKMQKWCRVRHSFVERSLDYLTLNSKIYNTGLIWKRIEDGI